MQTFSLRDPEGKKEKATQNKPPHIYKFLNSLSETRMLSHRSLQSKQAARSC